MQNSFGRKGPDYDYLKSVFRHLREELDVLVTRTPKKLPDVPTEEEIERYYKAVWKSHKFQDMVIIKTFLYTGIRGQRTYPDSAGGCGL